MPRSLVGERRHVAGPSRTTTSLRACTSSSTSGTSSVEAQYLVVTPARVANRLGDHFAVTARGIGLSGGVDVVTITVEARSKDGAKSSTRASVRVTRWGWKTAVMRS